MKRKKLIWYVSPDNVGYRIEHPQGTDGFHVYLADGNWCTVYKSLVGAKKWVSRRMKQDYHKIEYVETYEVIE